MIRITSALKQILAVSGLLLVLIICAVPVRAGHADNSVSGTLIGHVWDAKNKPNTQMTGIVKAFVKVRNISNGHEEFVLTNSAGEYRVPFLPEGRYTITASKSGYKEETHTGLWVTFGAKTSVPNKYFWLNFILQPVEAPRTAGPSVLSHWPAAWEMSNPLAGDQTGEAIEGPTISDETASAAASSSVDSTGAAPQTPAVQPIVSARQATEGEKATGLIRSVEVSRGAHFDERQINSLPLSSLSFTRTFDDLALLTAGVAHPPYTPGARGPGVGFGVGTAGQYSVNGLRARSNNFSVDGSDNNDADVGVRRQGFVALIPQPIESVHAVSLATMLWDAEQGRNSGAQVNAVSKYGENQFHGKAFGFFTDSRLNARNFFDYTGGGAGGQDPFTRTQIGGVIGGPIVIDRTHFFASFERDQVRASSEQHFATPAQSERRFRRMNPATFPDADRIGVFAFNALQNFNQRTPLGENILSLYPLPNQPDGPYGANTFTQVLPADGNAWIASLRLTHQIAKGHQLNARYNFTDDERTLPAVNQAIGSTLDVMTRSHNLSLILDSGLSLTVFNQARFSFGRTRLDFREPSRAVSISQPCSEGQTRRSTFINESCSESSIVIGPNTFPFPSQTGPIGELLIEPYSPVGVGVFYFPQNRRSNTFQYADTVTWLLDRHQIKSGGSLRRYQLNSRLDRLYRPQVVYGAGEFEIGQVIRELDGRLRFDSQSPRAILTGVELASLGTASAVLQTITSNPPDSTIGLRFNEYQIFFNDNWRVRSNFTLDYGLRYEYSSVPHSVGKRIERVLALENVPTPGASRFNRPDRLDKFDAAVAAYRQILDGRNRIYDQDRNNFGPHLGFAWDPFFNRAGQTGKTVIRGGYGIYYDAILGALVTQSRNVFPNEIPVNIDPSFLQFDAYSLNNPALLKIVRDAQGNFTNPVSLLQPGVCNQFGTCNRFGGAPEDFVAVIGQLFNQNQLGGGLAFTLTDKRLRTPYAMHWHLTVERELFDDYFVSAAYVGTKGTKLTRLTTPNKGSIVTPFLALANSLDDRQNNANNSIFSFPVVFNSLDGAALVGGQEFNRPNQKLGAYQIYENSAASIYHALQLEAGKRYNYGIKFTAAYTWSHAIDDVSDIFTLSGASILPQDGGQLRLERGDASFDVRHRFASSAIWDLPFFENRRGGLKLLFGDWQISGLFSAQTGQPFTLAIPFDRNRDGNFSDRPQTTQGLVFATGQRRQRIALPANLTFVNFLSTPGAAGAVGRNTLRGDAFINLDLASQKSFKLGERINLIFRAEFFNLLNRANFGLPARMIGAPGFGSAVETVNSARVIQFALKLTF